jgi:hypothetical protein
LVHQRQDPYAITWTTTDCRLSKAAIVSTIPIEHISFSVRTIGGAHLAIISSSLTVASTKKVLKKSRKLPKTVEPTNCDFVSTYFCLGLGLGRHASRLCWKKNEIFMIQTHHQIIKK